MKKILYYAVCGNGRGCIFASYPTRNLIREIWVGKVVGFYSMLVMQFEENGMELPPIGWEDEPVKLKINLEICLEKRLIQNKGRMKKKRNKRKESVDKSQTM